MTLRQQKAELEDYRQDTERKFTELSNLVNSKEIDKLKEEISLLSIDLELV